MVEKKNIEMTQVRGRDAGRMRNISWSQAIPRCSDDVQLPPSHSRQPPLTLLLAAYGTTGAKGCRAIQSRDLRRIQGPRTSSSFAPTLFIIKIKAFAPRSDLSFFLPTTTHPPSIMSTTLAPALQKGELVLVTGATGHIGATTVEAALKAGLRVRATARTEAKAERLKAYFSPRYGPAFETCILPDMRVPDA